MNSTSSPGVDWTKYGMEYSGTIKQDLDKTTLDWIAIG